METDIHEIIKINRDESSIDWSMAVKYREYYEGKQLEVLTEEQKIILENLTDNEYADNVCDGIVNGAVDRLQLLGFTCENEAVQQFLSMLWLQYKIDAVQTDIYRDTMIDGNHVLALGWDNVGQKLQIFMEPWWNGEFGVWIHYDSTKTAVFGVKQWRESENLIRRNVWFPDRVERYASEGGTEWDPYNPGDGTVVPWVSIDGTPMGIPYIHFANAGKMSGPCGKSELSGGILGYQDQLNDAQWSLSGGMRMTAFQVYWASGVGEFVDENGTPIEGSLKLTLGSFFTSKSADAKYGSIPAGDLSQVIAGYKEKLRRVAQISRTPLHTITGGDWPSGEALVHAERPAVEKAHTNLRKFRQAWIDMLHLAIKIQNRYGIGAKLDESIETATLGAVFDDPEKRDLLAKASAMNNLRGIVSVHESLRYLGYSEKQAEEIYQEMVQEEAQKAEALLAAVDRNEIQ